jgi:hypothetical protein
VAVLALYGAKALGIGSAATPLGRCIAAVIAAQALLRGTAPRHQREAASATTLIGRASNWFIDDLDKLAATRVQDDVAKLDREQASGLAHWLYEQLVRTDSRLSEPVRNRALREISQLEGQAGDGALRELRSKCKTMLVEYGETLGKQSRRLYFGDD